MSFLVQRSTIVHNSWYIPSWRLWIVINVGETKKLTDGKFFPIYVLTETFWNREEIRPWQNSQNYVHKWHESQPEAEPGGYKSQNQKDFWYRCEVQIHHFFYYLQETWKNFPQCNDQWIKETDSWFWIWSDFTSAVSVCIFPWNRGRVKGWIYSTRRLIWSWHNMIGTVNFWTTYLLYKILRLKIKDLEV